ncbi:MAG: ADP-ribosylglycohydrolase family protein [Planctomycetes bacterium]|nr:ADP-ribosylglycohydrolase family protein [Planctomycetota bacterium]
MLGAIAGDVIGSVHEGAGTKTKDFPLFTEWSRFTDDTVLTVAVAEKLLRGGDYVDLFHEYVREYPTAGYGGTFIGWAGHRKREPYNSWGNGSAMRVSPVGAVFDSLDAVEAEAKRTADVTHNHPEGVRGAQATAAAVFLARTGHDKPAIRAHVESAYGYDLGRRLDDIRPRYRFDVSCQGSVPQSIIAFLESADYEDAVRNAISLGGDADTMACIAGAIAEAFYGGVPDHIRGPVLERLDDRIEGVLEEFTERYGTRLKR